MRFKRHIELEKGRLDMAPLIDVVFLLLIFFMLSTSFITQEGIKVNLPGASTSELLPEGEFVIYVMANDRVRVNNKNVGAGELRSRLDKAAIDKGRILIKADKRASMGKVIELWDMCRDAGIANINIATARKD